MSLAGLKKQFNKANQVSRVTRRFYWFTVSLSVLFSVRRTDNYSEQRYFPSSGLGSQTENRMRLLEIDSAFLFDGHVQLH